MSIWSHFVTEALIHPAFFLILRAWERRSFLCCLPMDPPSSGQKKPVGVSLFTLKQNANFEGFFPKEK